MFGLLYGIPATYSQAADYSKTQPVLTQWLQEQGYELSLFSSQDPLPGTSLYQGFNDGYVPQHKINAALADTATLHHWQKHYEEHKERPELASAALRLQNTGRPSLVFWFEEYAVAEPESCASEFPHHARRLFGVADHHTVRSKRL